MNSNSKNKNPFWVSVGQRINTLLVTSGKSQKELAEYLNIIPNTISYWTAGTRTPNTEQIVKIAAFFECTSDYILGLSDVQSPDTDIQAICKYTGLSEKALRNIKGFDRYYDINQIFEDYTFFKFMICTYENFKKHYKPINKRNNDDA